MVAALVQNVGICKDWWGPKCTGREEGLQPLSGLVQRQWVFEWLQSVTTFLLSVAEQLVHCWPGQPLQFLDEVWLFHLFCLTHPYVMLWHENFVFMKWLLLRVWSEEEVRTCMCVRTCVDTSVCVCVYMCVYTLRVLFLSALMIPDVARAWVSLSVSGSLFLLLPLPRWSCEQLRPSDICFAWKSKIVSVVCVSDWRKFLFFFPEQTPSHFLSEGSFCKWVLGRLACFRITMSATWLICLSCFVSLHSWCHVTFRLVEFVREVWEASTKVYIVATAPFVLSWSIGLMAVVVGDATCLSFVLKRVAVVVGDVARWSFVLKLALLGKQLCLLLFGVRLVLHCSNPKSFQLPHKFLKYLSRSWRRQTHILVMDVVYPWSSYMTWAK